MLEVIEKWKLNKGVLASKMGMPEGTFYNKISPKHSTSFSRKELIQLKVILLELSGDLDEVAKIDFNEALGEIVN